MNSEDRLEGVPEFYYTVSKAFLKQLEEYFKESNYIAVLIERSEESPLDTLAVNFGDADNPISITFTFVPIPEDNYAIDSILLQIYTILPMRPRIEIINELEKALLFINNQIPVGHFGISNGNEITLRTVQNIPVGDYEIDAVPIDRIIDFFEMILSIYSPYLTQICTGALTFKEFVFSLG